MNIGLKWSQSKENSGLFVRPEVLPKFSLDIRSPFVVTATIILIGCRFRLTPIGDYRDWSRRINPIDLIGWFGSTAKQLLDKIMGID